MPIAVKIVVSDVDSKNKERESRRTKTTENNPRLCPMR